MFAPGATPRPPTRPAREVAHDVAVEVGQDQDVVQLGLLDELHAHVVHDPVFELDLAFVGRGDGPAGREEQAVRELHDVGFVDRRDLPPAIRHRVVEAEAGNPLRRGPGDDLYALGRVRTDHVLDAGVEVLSVLADDDQVHGVISGLEARDGPDRAQVGVQAEGLAEGHVHRPEAFSDRRRDGALDRDLVAQNRVEDVLREGRPLLRHDRFAGFDDLPIELDTRGVEDSPGCLGQFGADAVSGNQGHCLSHARDCSGMTWPEIQDRLSREGLRNIGTVCAISLPLRVSPFG